MYQKKKKNIYFTLLSKEYSNSSNINQNLSIVKSLDCHKDAEFYPVLLKKSKDEIFCVRERLYFENYRKSVLIYEPERQPTSFFKLDRRQFRSPIQSSLVAQCPLSNITLKDHGYRGSLLTLSDNNVLRRMDIENGNCLQELILPEFYHFRFMFWNNENESFYVQSVQTPISTQDKRGVMAISVFEVFPLKYVGTFELMKNIFGNDIKNVLLKCDFLVVYKTNLSQFYSLEQILKEGKICNVDQQNMSDSKLPINIKITKSPDLLLQLNAFDKTMLIGGFPSYAVFKDEMSFKPISLAYQLIAKNSKMRMWNNPNKVNNLPFETVKCFLHPDGSGRICHQTFHEFTVMKFKQLDSARTLHSTSQEMHHKFTIDLKRDTLQNNKTEDSSGRLSTEKQVKEIIHSVDYNEDFNLLVVTFGERITEKKYSLCVNLYDNVTGEFLQSIPLMGDYTKNYRHQITLDLDVLIHLLVYETRNGNQQYRVHVYKLFRRERNIKTEDV